MEQKPEPENKPLTWDECKNEVVREFGFGSWIKYYAANYLYGSRIETALTEAAELYAESQFHRGAREQREICYNNREPLYLCSEDYYQEFDEIAARVLLNAPAPEFKA